MKIDPIWTALLFGAQSTSQSDNSATDRPKLTSLEELSAESQVNQVDIPTKIGTVRLVYCSETLFLFSFEAQPGVFPGYDELQAVLTDSQWSLFDCKAEEGLPMFCKILGNITTLAPVGTDFQRLVWQALQEIPEGKPTTYGVLAESLRSASHARAVGSAVGKNSIALVIPCHRVVPAAGGVGQFRWGTVLKTQLLHMERERASA